MFANVIDKHLCNIIIMDIENYDVSNNTKVTIVRPVYNKESRDLFENYRPVLLLNAFSKIYERYIHIFITLFINNFPFIFISAYWKSYSSNHALIRLIKNWKQPLHNQKFVGAYDFSKVFDCIPYNFLITKMHPYGFSIDSLKILFLFKG